MVFFVCFESESIPETSQLCPLPQWSDNPSISWVCISFQATFRIEYRRHGGRWCFCCFIQISQPLFIERRTFARPTPRYRATSAAEWPVFSTAKNETNALASTIFFFLLPEHINSGLSPNLPPTTAINSSIGRLSRYFFSRKFSDCLRTWGRPWNYDFLEMMNDLFMSLAELRSSLRIWPGKHT